MTLPVILQDKITLPQAIIYFFPMRNLKKCMHFFSGRVIDPPLQFLTTDVQQTEIYSVLVMI